MVTQTPASLCDGEVISAERAREFEAARRTYIKRAITDPGSRGPYRQSARQGRATSSGSGFFVNRQGNVVTNYHVVEKCRRLMVLTNSGKVAAASVVAASRLDDLALLRTDTTAAAFATLAPGAPDAEASLRIVGFPMLKLPRRDPLSVSGRFVGERSIPSGDSILVIEAQVWRGSSGSPVIDTKGQVVGVVFAKANIPAIYQASGKVLDDHAFAIPARRLSALLNRHNLVIEQGRNKNAIHPPHRYSVRVDCYR